MTQEEVLNILEESSEMMTAREIAQKASSGYGSVSVSLRVLRDNGEIRFVMLKRSKHNQYLQTLYWSKNKNDK